MKRFVLSSLGIAFISFFLVGIHVNPSLGATPDDTLVIGFSRAHQSLYPGTTTGLADIWANMLLYDSLVIHDSEGKIHPGLAKRWEMSKDGLTWTFYLREDVKFHSGRKFTANDVKAHFENWKNLATAKKIDALDRTEVVNDYTVRFIMKYPTLVWLLMISQTEWSYSGIPDSEAVKKYGKDYGVVPESVSGTGPFKLTKWMRADRLEFVRNPDYIWGPAFYKNQGPAHIQKVIIRTLPEAASRTAALERREIDLDSSLSEKDTPRLAKLKGMNVIIKPKNTIHHLGFNHKRPIWNDLRVRQALMHGVNQDVIVDVVYNGYAKKSIGMWAESVEGHTLKAEMAKIALGYNPQKAKQLLDEAGWKMASDGIRRKEGKPLSFTVYIYTEYQANLMTVIKEQWREIGADAAIRQMEWAGYLNAMKAAEHDMYYIDGTHHTADISYWFTCNAIPFPNSLHWCDPATEKSFEITQKTLVSQERVKAFQDIEKDFMNRAVLIPMPHTLWMIGAWDYIKDLEIHPVHGYYKLMDVKKSVK
jgi:peptide/nickel transport system substrate-binding protein